MDFVKIYNTETLGITNSREKKEVFTIEIEAITSKNTASVISSNESNIMNIL